MDTSRHSGKVAIVTGAANGIGRATVLRLAAEGARVVGFDVNDTALAETSEALGAAGLTAELVAADITSQADVDRVVALAGPRIDVLANVAGIMDHFLPLGEVDDATWERVLGVNLTGVMRLTRAVLPVMLAQDGGGAIVTVASKASLGAGASGVAYTTSKHGVIGLVRSVAYFYGPQGIRSNAVLPGAVETAIGATAAPQSEWAMQRAMLSMGVMGSPAQPDQIASVVSWLASEEASNVNGATVSADGGWSTA
ncbi:MAG: SDR family oxidoreductase [Frankiales bacterium]|nr:SDR family oxidoreductase [Frankiales bacterium]